MQKSEDPAKPFQIPPEGSLGLLALGAAGLFAWREARMKSGFEEKILEQSRQSEADAQKKIELIKAKQKEKKQHEK